MSKNTLPFSIYNFLQKLFVPTLVKFFVITMYAMIISPNGFQDISIDLILL